MKRLTIAFLPLLLGAAPAGPTLGPIRLQLYYKTSGTLSADVAPPARLSLWNTGAGEGDVKEPAEDLLVSVPIQMPPGRDMGENSELPLTISVRTRAGKLLASRTFKFISIPYRDPVWSPPVGQRHPMRRTDPRDGDLGQAASNCGDQLGLRRVVAGDRTPGALARAWFRMMIAV